jgi:hypothetical protein
MAIVGVLANSTHASTGGNVVQNFATLTHTFGPSSIWGHPSLQRMHTLDDDASADATVSQFVDASGTHNVSSIGVFANQCTSITYTIVVRFAGARALCITEFFG